MISVELPVNLPRLDSTLIVGGVVQHRVATELVQACDVILVKPMRDELAFLQRLHSRLLESGYMDCEALFLLPTAISHMPEESRHVATFLKLYRAFKCRSPQVDVGQTFTVSKNSQGHLRVCASLLITRDPSRNLV